MEVIILAGGLGTRLRSVVQEVPKCMAPVGGRPFLAYLLDWIQMYPVDHVVFSVGYLKEWIIDFMQKGNWPFAYDFACEETPLGTGGGIRLALGFCREETVFVVNGDSFFPVRLDAMPTDGALTLALQHMEKFERYGAVTFSGNRISAFREKRYCEEGFINGGIYAIKRSRLDLSAFPEKFSFEKEVLEPMAACGELRGWDGDSYFIDIGIPEDYARAQWEIPAWFALRKASDAVMKADADTLFLDRDGVINRLRPGDYVKNWEEFEYLPGILPALCSWSARFRHLILVTNQRGVGKGLMTDADLSRIHAHMMKDILAAGGRLDLILVCTSTDDADPRRKPHPGMFEEACALFPDIQASRCVMLGDSDSDAAFAAACGMPFIRLG